MRLRSARFAVVALLLVPFLPHPTSASAGTASFNDAAPCLAGGSYVLGASESIPGCSFEQSGTLAVDSCTTDACLVTITMQSAGAGMLPGTHSLVTTSDDDGSPSGQSTVCSASDVSTGSALSCSGSLQVTLQISSTCRFLLLDTVAANDAKVAGAEMVDSFRVCTDGSITPA